MAKKPTLPGPVQPPEFDDGLNFSKKQIIKTFYISLLVAVVGISAFLIYQEYKKPKALGDDSMFARPTDPDSRDYANDYWGFRFSYPGSWLPVVGSFEDGEYYFASEPINFISELESGQAMVEIKTYIDWKHLSFSDWLKDMQANYLPQGLISGQSLTQIKNLPAISYSIALKKPLNNTAYWQVLAISKTDNVKYLFILETANQADAKNYAAGYKKILDSVEFYKGFGAN